MGNISNLFGGDFTPPPPKKEAYQEPPERQLIDAIANHGYEPPTYINFDGKIHRFSTTGKKKDDSGWYVAYSGKISAGAFGDWKEGTTINWRQDLGRELSLAEQMEHASRMKQLKAVRDTEEKAKQSNAADTVSSIWSNATDANNDHPYLQNKGVKSHGLKVTGDGRLIVPMFDANGDLVSVQYIDGSGEKRYHSGGKVSGAFYALTGEGDVIIAEGYATAATIHEETKATVYVAFSAGQLPAVAMIVKKNHPDQKIIIVADNDNSGTGQKEAKKAADLINALVVIPPDIGTDANDYHQSGGDIASLIYPPADDWLIPADEFASEPSPIKWLIKGHLQSDALIMVHGPSGGGKTFLVLDMCLHLAAGKKDWNEHKTNPAPIVYLAGEGHHGLKGRIAAWKQHHNADTLDMWLSKAGTDLNTPEGYNRTRQALLHLPYPPGLIVIDTLHRFLSGDENSAQDAKTMLDACNAIQQEFGCSVLLVHHTGVNEDAQHRARGSSAWRGALDIEISIVPATEDQPIQIIQRKSKDAELSSPVAMRLESVYIDGWFDEDGDQVSSAVAVVDNSKPNITNDGKYNKYISDFLLAWESSGKEKIGDCPYLSRSALKEWLKNHVTDSDRTVKNMLDKSRKGGMINTLLDQNLIRITGTGWIKLQSGSEAADALLGNITV